MKPFSFLFSILVLGSFIIFGCRKSNPITEAPSDSIVKIEEIVMPQLNRNRKIRIYLPKGYENSNQNYPVLYMHDAQNLFEDSTSYAGEWRVDEVLDSLFITDHLALIVVGIDHGNELRFEELVPFVNEEYVPNPKGNQYLDFIVNTLKPHIDKNYRTKTNVENTGIMGSSLGGLMAHYAIFKYPKVFGKAGVFSPSYWINDEIYEFTKTRKLLETSKMKILYGAKESEEDITKPVGEMWSLLNQQKVKFPLEFALDPNGEHNEALWKKHLAESVLWLFKDEN